MVFQLIPVAEASTESVLALVKSIDKVIINPIIVFLFACAIAYFLYGVAQYFLSPDSEEVRKKSKVHMLWGIIGLFIMVAVFGIMRLILNTVGESRIKINNNGDYTINGTNIADRDINPLEVDDPFESVGNISTEDLSLTQDRDTITLPKDTDPVITPDPDSENPFKKEYEENPLCWRGFSHGEESTEFKALQSAKSDAREQYMSDNGITDPDENKNYPVVFDRKNSFESSTKLFHVWWDVRAPIGGGTMEDCNLKEILPPEVLPEPKNESTKPNPLIGIYFPDPFYYRATGSGVSTDLGEARSIAVNNALIRIAAQKGLTSVRALFTDPNYNPIGENGEINLTAITGVIFLEEQYYPKYPPNSKTAEVDYWVALQFIK